MTMISGTVSSSSPPLVSSGRPIVSAATSTDSTAAASTLPSKTRLTSGVDKGGGAGIAGAAGAVR